MEAEDPRAGDEEQGDHEPAVAGVGDDGTASGEDREDEVAEEARGVDLPACGGESFDEHSRKDAADIGGDEVARHESAGQFFGVFVVVLEEECEPGARNCQLMVSVATITARTMSLRRRCLKSVEGSVFEKSGEGCEASPVLGVERSRPATSANQAGIHRSPTMPMDQKGNSQDCPAHSPSST